MRSNRDRIARLLLRDDSLARRQKLAGDSRRKSGVLMVVGMLFSMARDHVRDRALKRELEAGDDTAHDTTIGDYLRIAAAEGFELALEIPFDGGYGQETYRFMFNRADGILLAFDTRGDSRVSKAKFYYNWRPRHPELGLDRSSLSTGHYREDGDGVLWVGHDHCREALRHRLAMLREKGRFVTPWIEQPWLDLCHYAESYRPAVAMLRLASLPQDVRVAMGSV